MMLLKDMVIMIKMQIRRDLEYGAFKTNCW